MSEWAAKRFWTAAEAVAQGAGHSVELDGRAVKTPSKAPLVVPSRAMAEAVAAEWRAQGERIDPMSMPVTRGANAAIDRVRVQHAEVADMLADYGDSDLLCYRAEAPAELVSRQAAAWDPLLDWAGDTFGARLSPRTGIMHEAQDPEALARLRREVHALDAFDLTAFHDLVSLSGSLVIGLAAERGAHDPEALWAASRIDETWQEELWGADEEAADVAAKKRGAFLDAVRFLALARAE
ncbi:ATP12 family chaperone protein [Roseivivax sediminis]|uniref:Chaperone required for the assembly of the F1-ATPase n=1 Tax=Roseivivax sediminis TaxID=936889 RepID=A0A1I1ZGX4_9RHOB|nr:ATP12 family protein [Roseivivax sediminis]SFE30981.1 Chaperone required for the assembly of the F1-ATPase [Roseivivax sediminis]